MKKTIIGIIIMTLSLGGIIFWEAFGREELLFTDVLVLNQDTEAYTEISEDMLAIKKVYMPNKLNYTINNLNDVVGKQTTQFVPKGTELHQRYLQDPELIVNEETDEYVFSLSVSNLKAYPRSIAKGDNVYVYYRDYQVLKTTVLGLRDSNGNEVMQSNDRTVLTGQIASIEIKAGKKKVEELSYMLDKGNVLSLSYN